MARAGHTAASDVDVLVVLEDGADVTSVEEELRDVGYDVMLEFGTVFGIHAVTESNPERRSDHSFVENVLAEGRAIDG